MFRVTCKTLSVVFIVGGVASRSCLQQWYRAGEGEQRVYSGGLERRLQHAELGCRQVQTLQHAQLVYRQVQTLQHAQLGYRQVQTLQDRRRIFD